MSDFISFVIVFSNYSGHRYSVVKIAFPSPLKDFHFKNFDLDHIRPFYTYFQHDGKWILFRWDVTDPVGKQDFKVQVIKPNGV